MFILIGVFLTLCSSTVIVSSQAVPEDETSSKIIRYCDENEGCRACNPLSNVISLNVSCTYLDRRIPCQNGVPPGTVARVKCKNAYFLSNAPSFTNLTICLSDGKWSNTLQECTPNCGEPILSIEETLVSYGQIAQPKEFPWHAGIYLNLDNTWTQICGGTILSSHIIITAAHCVYLEKTGEARDPDTIRVSVGKYLRAWDVPELHSQRRKVRGIYLSPYYRGRKTNYERDLALLDLHYEIEFNDFVLPICMDWARKLDVENGELGTVVGWGLSKNDVLYDNLRYIRLPQLEFNDCLKKSTRLFLKFITPDKFCAGYLNGTGVQQGDSGCSLTVSAGGKHFLRGLVSVKPSKNDSFGVFTDVMDLSHISWVNQTITRLNIRYKAESKFITRRGECVLPDKFDGLNFTVLGCNDYNTSSQCLGNEAVPVANGTQIKLFCDESYETDSNTTIATCENGAWNPKLLSCRKQCASPNLEYSKLRCRYKKKIVPCPEKNSPTYMVISQSCLKNYKAPIGSSVLSWCQPNGQWTEILKSCIPACGQPNSNRSLTYLHKQPWKVGIYRAHQSNDSLEFLCSGVRYLGLLVITAADCVAFEDTEVTIKASSLRVVGSVQVDWDSQDLTLTWEVTRIMVPNKYRGKYSKYEENIALLRLGVIDLGTGRLVSVCFDKTLLDGSLHAKHGLLASWKGRDAETEIQSEVITEQEVEIIAPLECLKKYPSVKPVMTQTKFCVEKAPGILLRPGSSLLTKGETGYYIQGVKLTNYNQTFEEVWVFTNITSLSPWISHVSQLQLIESLYQRFEKYVCIPPEKYSNSKWCVNQ